MKFNNPGRGRSWAARWRAVLALALLFSNLLAAHPAIAQDDQSNGPVYVVQAGDSLWDIALRFGVSMDDLMQANGITNPNQLQEGARLVIPGLEGIQGELTTERVPLGETLHSLSRRYRVPEPVLIRLNHLTSPDELYVGASLIIPKQDETPVVEVRAALQPGQSLLELAVLQSANPWTFLATNSLTATWQALPGDVLLLPGTGQAAGPGALPEAISSLAVNPTPLVQGKTSVIEIGAPAGVSLSGALAGYPLHFFRDQDGNYYALQGIYALQEPGLYSFSLSGSLPGGETFGFSQGVFVRAGDYPYDPALKVDPGTIDPAVTAPEDAQWKALASAFTPDRQWDGKFTSPAPPPFNDCWPSRFGNRRSYNGSAYIYFHTGLDFCGGVGTEILAPADGAVIFAGPLTVRGNATMIDHGWGVYSGYMHQSRLLVKVGDRVVRGQIIGLVGGTGRVTGPHLHWEIFIGGVQVDPMDWLEQAYPSSSP